MKFKYKFVLSLILLGMVALSASTVFAASSDSQNVKATVDGVDFLLYDSCDIFNETENCVYFAADSEICGYVASLASEAEVNAYTKNDFSNGYVVSKIENASVKGDVYAYVDNLNDLHGCFLIFQKDNKKFIFDSYASTNSSDEAVSNIAFLIKKFSHDNDISPVVSMK